MPRRNQIKVCILTSVHPPFDTRVFHNEAKNLVKAGYDVTLIAQHNRDEIMDGVKIAPLPKPKHRFERIVIAPWRILKLALKEKANVYHFHDPELIHIGIVLKLLTRANVIYDVHEDYHLSLQTRYWVPSSTRKLVAALVGRVESLSSSFFDAIIPATPAIAARFKSTGRNLVIVRNFPCPDEFLTINDGISWRKRANAVAYIGAIDMARGMYEMIRAIKIVQKSIAATLILAGDFDSVEEREKAESQSGWEYVNYKGFLHHQDVIQVLGSVKAGLILFHPLPNHIYAQPNKLFEYMSAGIPVIASNFPLWREIVDGAGCGLTVDPLVPEAICQAIVYILQHPKEAEAMGKRGRIAVEDHYNWYTEEKRLLSLYNGLLDE